MDAKFSESCVGIEFSTLLDRHIALVGGVIGEITGGEFEERIVMGEKTGVHNSGRCRVAYIRRLEG